MSQVSYSSDAQLDLLGIWNFIYGESRRVDIADNFLDKIFEKAQLYASQPLLGQSRPDLDVDVRCFPVGNYVVFYIPRGDGIQIVQVIHGSRNIKTHFRGQGKPPGGS
jgi:toxin ParE1/3/4